MWSANPRDIALIFLSLEALVMLIVPLTLITGLAYGIYRLRALVRKYLRLAFSYLEQAREAVERASHAIAEPFIRVRSTLRMIQVLFQNVAWFT